MILVHYPACGCLLEIPRRDAKEEIERSTACEKCPRCRAREERMTNPSEAAAALGSIRTPRKSQSSSVNLARARASKPAPVCTCGRDPHRAGCPVYQAEASRRYRAKKQASEK